MGSSVKQSSLCFQGRSLGQVPWLKPWMLKTEMLGRAAHPNESQHNATTAIKTFENQWIIVLFQTCISLMLPVWTDDGILCTYYFSIICFSLVQILCMYHYCTITITNFHRVNVLHFCAPDLIHCERQASILSVLQSNSLISLSIWRCCHSEI